MRETAHVRMRGIGNFASDHPKKAFLQTVRKRRALLQRLNGRVRFAN